MLSSVAYMALPHFKHYLIHGRIFGKKNGIDPKIFFFLFSLHLSSETFITLRIIERDMIKMCIGLHVKYQLFLSNFNETQISSTIF